MNQRVMRSLISAAACGCIALPALAQQEPPNLIFILTDDMGLEAIRWAGDEGNTHARIFTDNLSAMSAQGVSFTRCRVNPNCSPTRACLMTGRSALDNGVVGVIGRYDPLEEPGNPCVSLPLDGPPAQVTNRLGLQTQERTIAEVLQDMGYYTILIDKWHLGYNEDGENRLHDPLHKGFDVFEDWQDSICIGYGTYAYMYADVHMVRMAEKARIAVNGRPDPEQPYALFYHTITPHSRHADSTGKQWWDISDTSLIPQTIGYGHTKEARFAKNLEAIDSVLFRDLLTNSPEDRLGVLDADRNYRPASNTIVFFLGDNGTDPTLTNYRGKNTLFERGVRVPLFVMGAGITGSELENTWDKRQISHVDIYDTTCDIVQAPPEVRDNEHGAFPRRGASFAYNIGWSDRPRADQ